MVLEFSGALVDRTPPGENIKTNTAYMDLNAKSLNPWRPDYIKLLEIYPFLFLIISHSINIILLIFVLWSVVLYIALDTLESSELTVVSANSLEILSNSVKNLGDRKLPL
ncbi:hypothetical protein ILYODFUR_009548 [Ilyodon furcidens]|uniref:Uncharacterized protein n=1 Tax=Ilyodon furcidens TaxID=33524 RepID=A0ABV0V3S2_9TELE